MDTSHRSDSFRGLLLRHRGRTGLIQRDLAARAGVGRRSVQDWETGLNHPTAERLKALIRAFLEAGGLTQVREASEARDSSSIVRWKSYSKGLSRNTRRFGIASPKERGRDASRGG
jgi:transcriptional regulator with XRE-family HTH domain